MKIGIFTDTYPPEINGVATVSKMLTTVFRSQGHEVFVVTTGEKMKQSYIIDGQNKEIVRVSSRAFKHLYNYRMAWIYNRKAARYIKSLDLDIIHVQTEIGIGLFGRLISKIYHIPLVYTYHTFYEDYTYYVTKGRNLFDRFAKRVVADISRICADTSTEFTTTSNKTRSALRRYGVSKYINVVPNGIDLDIFKDEEIHHARILNYKKAHKLDDKFILLILGRIAKEKSNDILLKNLASFINHNENTNLHLLIVGGGPDTDNLIQLTKDLNIESYVDFVGPVPYEEVPFYYHLADLFISASISETQGMTFIESMASHTLVLARYDECLQGVIEEGKSGYFFRSEAEFEEKLAQLISLDDKSLYQIKDTSYKLVTAKYSMKAYYDAMLDVYNRALRKYW